MRPTRTKTPARTMGVAPGAGYRTPSGVGGLRSHARTPLRTPNVLGGGLSRPRVTASSATATVPLPGGEAVSEESQKDPVEVFCRVRPNVEEDHSSCIKVLSNTTLQLTPPVDSKAYGTGKETQYSFKEIFGEDSSQPDVFQRVGLPLVEDLVKGNNGLLFTYGVTGSGKTHTMQGSLQDGGIMNRVIDVLFNTVKNVQTSKYRLQSDRFNGFEVSSEAEAKQTELINNMKNGKYKNRPNTSDPDLSTRVPETSKVSIDEDAQYSVFISYVEVYNNYIYDLLEHPQADPVSGKPKLASKGLREDNCRNMYVYGVTETEVKTPEEALNTFFRGQRQRRVAQTMLNLQSSRSHSIFNIRLVAVPYDPLGEDIMCDPTVMTVSQLALVDLAGSERTARTGNTGERLAEASKINQSLMTLRTCIEILRENQQTNGSKMVPYRDSRVTHLFRNYFEGEGKVKMIVCVNPRISDFDENVNVMKFSELTQEVQIERPTAVRFDLGLTPGRRRGNEIYKEALRRIDATNNAASSGGTAGLVELESVVPIYSLGPDWPPLELKQCDDEEAVLKLKHFLEKRIAIRKRLGNDNEEHWLAFRDRLVKLDEEMVLMRNENKNLKVQYEAERKRCRQLENRLSSAEAANRSLTEKVGMYADMKTLFEVELDEKELALDAEQKEKMRTRQKFKQKLQSEKEANTEREKRALIDKMKDKRKRALIKEKLDELNTLANSDQTSQEFNNLADDVENVSPSRTTESTGIRHGRTSCRTPMKSSASDPRLSMTPAPTTRSSIAAANHGRHRRSMSVGADKWLDHRPIGEPVPQLHNTVLQPILNQRKSVTKLEEKDIVNSATTKYMLTSEKPTADGQMETRLYKGDVVPTVGGGRQVIFNDVEVLHQEDPIITPSPRKRSYEEFRSVSARIVDLQQRWDSSATPTTTSARSKRSKV